MPLIFSSAKRLFTTEIPNQMIIYDFRNYASIKPVAEILFSVQVQSGCETVRLFPNESGIDCSELRANVRDMCTLPPNPVHDRKKRDISQRSDNINLYHRTDGGLNYRAKPPFSSCED
jgi:hypothetical protein